MPCLKIGNMLNGEEFFRQTRRFDVTILCVLQGKSTQYNGKNPAVGLIDIFQTRHSGARSFRVQVPNSPGSGKDAAKGKCAHREVESEGIWM